MNGNVIGRLCLVVIGLYLSSFLTFQVLTDYRNNLSSLFKHLAVGGLILGFITPRMGIYVLLIVCGYQDLLKRCLLFFGQAYFVDVITVLSIAPLLFAGICGGIVFARTRSGQFFDKKESKLLCLAIVMISVGVLMSAVSSGSLKSAVVAGSSFFAYIPMIVFSGILFPTLRDQRAYIRAALLIFIPVALYVFKQAFFGFSNFEIAYMKSGLTVISEGLLGGPVRPFSTMSSPHSLGIVLAMLFSFSIYMALSSNRLRVLYWALAFLYAGALIPGFGRTHWAMALMMPLCFFAFRSRGLTRGLYAMAVSGLVLLIAASGWLREDDNLFKFSVGQESNNEWVRAVGTSGTMGDRVNGFYDWSRNPEKWTLFGEKKNDAAGIQTHDMLGSFLKKYGVTGFLGILSFTAYGLFLTHRGVLRLRDPGKRLLCICYLSIIFSTLFTGAGSGMHIHMFPVSYLFWFAVGGLVAVLSKSRVTKKGEATVAGQQENSVFARAGGALVRGRGDGRSSLLGHADFCKPDQERGVPFRGVRGIPFRASGKMFAVGEEGADRPSSRLTSSFGNGKSTLSSPSPMGHE